MHHDIPTVWLLATLLSGAFTGAQAASVPVILYPPDLTLSPQPVILCTPFGRRGSHRSGHRERETDRYHERSHHSEGRGPTSSRTQRLNIGGKPVRVYYRAGSPGGQLSIKGGKGRSPMVFRSYYLHPAMEEGCGSCHVEEGGKTRAEGPETACYGCHDDYGKGGKPGIFLHEPVAAGSALPATIPISPPAPDFKSPGRAAWNAMTRHPGNGSCTLRSGPVNAPVPRPHAGVAPKQLVRSGNSLCTKCHENFHVVHRSATARGTMTKLPRDVPRDGNDLSCLACHLPHQSTNDRLLVKSAPELCHGCHPG